MKDQNKGLRNLKRDLSLLPSLSAKKYRKIKRSLKALGQMEAREAAQIALIFSHEQIKIRPRARLLSKMIVILALAAVATSHVAAYVDNKKADVVIGGHKILVAQAYLPAGPAANIDQAVSAHKSPFQFFKPVDGYVSQGFSAYHPANDIAAPLGAPVHSIGEGTVVFAGMLYEGHGNMVVIDNGDGLKSSYAHLGRIDVGIGNKVDGKTEIGTVGLTGRTTGPHVHMEIVDNGIYVDPSGILPK